MSNHPKFAAAIEFAHSDGNGLLAHQGSSYANLFSGDAERAVLTMSGAGRRKEGRTGAGYFGYFCAARPDDQDPARVRSWRSRANGWRPPASGDVEVEPRVERDWTYALLRTFTTVITRDVSVQGVMNDMWEGRAAIYVDMLGYDEVAHHSGPERVDTLAVLRDLDRQLGRIERTARWTPRPYKIVVLSDHGQTQGATFVQRTGQTLAELVAELCGAAASGDTDAEAGRTESTAWLRHARHADESTKAVVADVPIVLGSGSLGLISIPGTQHRLTREEIEARYPRLIVGLATHPEIGFVLVRQASGSSIVLGNRGSRDLTTGEVVGDDPLEPFGPRAVEQVSEVDGYSTVADLMVNSRYDPELEEIAAFEEQVSSHGGLGGPQTHPFLLYPTDLTATCRSDLHLPGDAQGAQGLARRARPSELRLTSPSGVSLAVAVLVACAAGVHLDPVDHESSDDTENDHVGRHLHHHADASPIRRCRDVAEADRGHDRQGKVDSPDPVERLVERVGVGGGQPHVRRGESEQERWNDQREAFDRSKRREACRLASRGTATR